MGSSEERVKHLINRYVKSDEIIADKIRRLERVSTDGEQSET